MTYQLNVQKIQDQCWFELTWGRSQRLRAQVPYPASLEMRYQQWQQAYLSFYKRALRGRVGAVGQVAATGVDLHSQLVQAEARLLSEFHRWLRQGELTDIRRTLSVAARETPVDLFLTCDPIATARLPWETWEIGAEYGGANIRIARSPNNIRIAPQAPRASHRKTRVLVILGDETGLNFAGDLQALQSLNALVELTFIGWTPGQDTVALKQDICRAIADPQGWDILFFAGHSNEADAVAGHIYVAPHTAIAIHELKPYLQTAQEKGLQFALFNSCSGLTIADALIELGLSQVAIMREPIHNQVAHSFLVQFLQSLVERCDVQDALQAACRHLKSEQHLTYPSAYLVPSLFRHPDSQPFQIPLRGWRQELQQWLPNRAQAIALSTIVLLSIIPGVQETLLSGRLLMQAMYRNLTGQMPTAPPAVVLVQVDEATLRQTPELAEQVSPISRAYLADVIDRLAVLEAEVIGIDYLLDFPQPDSPRLAATVRRVIEEKALWLVFSAVLEDGREMGVNPDEQIIDLVWAMEGYTNAPDWYMALPWDAEICRQTCPFPYLLALAAEAATDTSFPTPALTRQTPLRQELVGEIAASNVPSHQSLARRKITPITAFGGKFQQRWLRPILDFSLPPDRVFHRVSAYELFEPSPNPAMAQAIAEASVVLVGGVGYEQGGVDPLSSDISPNPPAIAYWRQWERDASDEKTFAGVEAIAYDVHHFLQSHYVTPIPALWLVGVAAVLGPLVALYGVPHLHSRRRGIWLLLGATAGYGWLSWQFVIATGILLPWLLPVATIWIYELPVIWRLKQQ